MSNSCYKGCGIRAKNLNGAPAPPFSGIDLASYTIENIVASSSLGAKLRLKEVAASMDDTEYNPDNFPGVIWRPKNTYGVVVIMDDGRMMCTNARSIEDVEFLFNRIVKVLEEKRIIAPRIACPNCGAVVEAEDVVCVECGALLQK